jgi:hypothetical protein
VKKEKHADRIARLADERFRPLEEVQSRQIQWLWPGFLPRNMVTLCDGYPDIGKSYLGIHITAQGSVGGEINGTKLKKFRSLILTTENHAELVLRPRFDAMRGDATMVQYDTTGASLDDEGLEVLRHKVRSFRPAFILLDPLFAYVPPGSNMYHPNVIRPFLNSLSSIIDESDAAMLAIRHPTKVKRDNPLYQGAGGVDVIAAARGGFVVAKHPQDEDMRVIAPIKQNIGRKVKSVMFELKDRGGDKLPVISWQGETDLTVEDIINANVSERAEELKRAMEWLKEFLEEGPQASGSVDIAAEKRSITLITLRRAKERLNVRSYKVGGPKGRFMCALREYEQDDQG